MLRSHGEIGYNLGRVYEAQGRRDDAIRTYELSLSTSEPYAEARQRLALLLGGDSEIDHRVEERRSQLTDIRTISIPNTHDADGVAEFGFCFLQGQKYSERSSLREMRSSAPLQRSWRLLPIPIPFPKPLTSGSSAGVG